MQIMFRRYAATARRAIVSAAGFAVSIRMTFAIAKTLPEWRSIIHGKGEMRIDVDEELGYIAAGLNVFVPITLLIAIVVIIDNCIIRTGKETQRDLALRTAQLASALIASHLAVSLMVYGVMYFDSLVGSGQIHKWVWWWPKN